MERHLQVLVVASQSRCLLGGPFSAYRRILESLTLEKTTKIVLSNHPPIPTVPTNSLHQCHTSTVLECLQGRRLHPSPWQTIPILLHSF